MKRTENLHNQDKAKEKDAQKAKEEVVKNVFAHRECARAQPSQAEAGSVASRAV